MIFVEKIESNLMNHNKKTYINAPNVIRDLRLLCLKSHQWSIYIQFCSDIFKIWVVTNAKPISNIHTPLLTCCKSHQIRWTKTIWFKKVRENSGFVVLELDVGSGEMVEWNTIYRTRAIIIRGLYTFYPLFKVHLCTVTFGLMYG